MSAVSLEDMKAYLKIDGDADDPVLKGVLDAAERVIAGRVGPLSPTIVTERQACTGRGVALNAFPVIELTTFGLLGSSTLDLDTLFIDAGAGVVNRTGDGLLSPGLYEITYVAGWSTTDAPLPADLALAVKELVRHMWQASQRGSSRRAGTPVDAAPMEGYLIPNAVVSLLQAYTLPGFA